MGLRQLIMPVRAWWFLRIARNSTIPPDVGLYLIIRRDRIHVALGEIERKRQTIVDEGTADGKTVPAEAALKSILKLRATYDGPDREEYVAELDGFIDDFQKKHGPQIPVSEAYAIVKDIEARLGRIE